jgi:type II secretory pathway pseudopilin PulG
MPVNQPIPMPRQVHRRERGYMLLILMFFVALLAFSMMAILPRVAQQVKRDKEEEMIHRGTEYARAVKKYYKKFNAYPNSIEALENTNNIRFLRRRYKDPMSKDGTWKLLHITDVQQGVSNPNFGVSQAGNFNPAQGAAGQGMAALGANAQGNPGQGISIGGGADASQSGGGGASTPVTQSGNSNDATSSSTPVTAGTSPGSPTSATGGQAGQTYGAGGIVGVESVSKAKSIREFDKKANYNKWMFIYDPTQDKGTLLKGPYNPQAFQGGGNTNGATGNGQPGQPGQPTSPGSAFGPSSGQQQQNGPGNTAPPDPNAPPQ